MQSHFILDVSQQDSLDLHRLLTGASDILLSASVR